MCAPPIVQPPAGAITQQDVPCKIQLVGMFPVEKQSGSTFVEQHLGPFTLPSQDPTLADFSKQLLQLVSLPGSSSHQNFRFEYSW